jgi:hypothetical protein
MVEELYDHRTDTGTDFDAMDTANIAYDSAHTSTCEKLFQVARDFFYVFMPPTYVPEPPSPGGCQSFCNKKKDSWAMKCKWVNCVDCPQCNKTQVLTTGSLPATALPPL